MREKIEATVIVVLTVLLGLAIGMAMGSKITATKEKARCERILGETGAKRT